MTILKQLEDQSAGAAREELKVYQDKKEWKQSKGLSRLRFMTCAGIDNPTDFILRSTRQTNSRAGREGEPSGLRGDGADCASHIVLFA